MKTVTMYEAKDGKQFHDEGWCAEYEQQLDDAEAATDMLHNGATLLAALIRANPTRPCWDAGLTAEDRVLLMKITGDTGLVVSHWQCSEKPGYKPVVIRPNGKVRLYGDAGCWSGPYGGDVDLSDLLRYANRTPHLCQAQVTGADT